VSHLHHKVSALIDGELQGAARRRAIAHARSCPECHRELEQTWALKQRLLGLAAAEPPADLFLALGEVRETPVEEHSQTSRAAIGRRALVGAGSVSLAVVTLAYVVGGANTSSASVKPPVEDFTAEFAGSTGLEPLSDPAVEALPSDTARRTTPRQGSIVQAATSTPRPESVEGDQPLAVHLLHRAASAPSEVAYSGVRRVAWYGDGGESAVTLDVEHAPGQGTSYAVTSGAEANGTFFAQSEAASSSSLGGEPVDLLLDAYNVAVSGHDSVDGRATTVITAVRDGEVAAQFWIDNSTGLLLRRALYDDERLVRVSELSDIETSGAGFMSHLPPELEAPRATKVSTSFAPSLTDNGWACPPKLPSDFSLTLLHRLQGTHDVMHAAYSDGLSSVSIFEERGALDTDALAGYHQVTSDDSSVWVQEGLPTVVVWQGDDTVYTMVTDAPASKTAELVAALPHEPDEGDGSRLGRGLTKIGSSVVPGE
jgi:Putative zinc-finger